MYVMIPLFVLWMSILTGAADDGRLDKRELKTLSRKQKRDLALSAAAKGRIADFKKLEAHSFWFCDKVPLSYRKEHCVKNPQGMIVSIMNEISPLKYCDVAAIQDHTEMVRFLLKRGYGYTDAGFYSAIDQDNGAIVDMFCADRRNRRRPGRNEVDDDRVPIYPQFAFAVVLGKNKAIQSFLSTYGIHILRPEGNASTNLEDSSLFSLAAVNGHPVALRQLIEFEYRYLRDNKTRYESALITEVKSLLSCLPSVLVRKICAYKGAERREYTWKGLKVVNVVLPSARPDLQGKTPLDYAQAELERSENEDERARLSECLDLLKNQDTKFMNFLFDEHGKAKAKS